MADVAITLLDAGHLGPIHALSRRGLLPHPHLDRPAPSATLPHALPSGLAALTRLVRQEASRARDAGQPWQPVIDALRHATQALWQGLSPTEQARFLRHLRGWWDVHRHRMPPRVADRLQQARTQGQLRIYAGRVLGTSVTAGSAEIVYRPRGKTQSETLRVARVINCTGPAADLTQVDDRLLHALLRNGLARADQLGLGLDIAGDGSVSGPAADRLFALGPRTKGRWWEITAVPDIRKQCQDIARTISDRLAMRANGATEANAVEPSGTEKYFVYSQV